MNNKKLCFILTIGIVLSCSKMFAQGDGARAYLLAPKGIWGINAKWLNLNQSIIPAGSTLVPGAEIKVDVFPTTLFHTFSIKGRFAQAYFMFNPGKGTATATDIPPVLPIPNNTSLNASGFSDGMLGFKLGLVGAPALNIIEFAKSPMQFSLFADARVWYSGTYSSDVLFNLGTNRLTFQVGTPMAIPLNQNRSRALWLEISPSVQFFAKNNEPSRGSGADEITQAPLFILENHLSHNITSKLWGVVNLRYQQGGQTSADGVKDDNTLSILGGGLGFGYQVLPPLSFAADYGKVLIGYNGANSDMFRVSMVFVYANMKKLKN